MAGLYIHVPFCAKRCIYCDFYSNTDMGYREPYLAALLKELELRRPYLENEPVETIYFGGGTPSQLTAHDFGQIFDAIYRLFPVAGGAEITIEANPDDVDASFALMLRRMPFNRVSMGVQSFDPEDLRFLNRRHTREQAVRAVGVCKDAGIYNVSIDLMYGLPRQTEEKWSSNIREALRLDVPHISAYHLTYEENTPLFKLLEKGAVKAVDEDASVALFSTLICQLRDTGYLHYEISNFAREGYMSRHNSSYWTGKKYLGLGPSAHSYNGSGREWNVASLPAWLEGIRSGNLAVERETLTADMQYNEYIITGLRTMWGISLDEIGRRFGDGRREYCEKQAAPYLKRGILLQNGTRITFSENGLLLSDGVMADFLFV